MKIEVVDKSDNYHEFESDDLLKAVNNGGTIEIHENNVGILAIFTGPSSVIIKRDKND